MGETSYSPFPTRALPRKKEILGPALNLGFQGMMEAPGVAMTPVNAAGDWLNRLHDQTSDWLTGDGPAAAPAAPQAATPPQPASPSGIRGITPEGQRAGAKVSGQDSNEWEDPGTTGKIAGSGYPEATPASRREDFGFSFKDPGHVVDGAERRASAFGGASPTYLREASVQFAEDDARRPQQVATQAYELQQKGLLEHDQDRARSMEIAQLKQQADLQRAEAIMQFEQTYGVPYSDASAPHIIQAAYEQQKDSDYEKQAAQYAQYLGMGSMPGPDGRVRPFTRADYDAAMLTLQFKMGSDKKSPGEFFRALVDRQAAADLEREAAATRQPPR